jgi:hypothetical protein
LYFILTILITEDDHNHFLFKQLQLSWFFFITYNKMKKYIGSSSAKMKGYWYWWHLWLSLFLIFLSISINEKNWFAESMFFVRIHWMEFVSHVKFRQLQTQRLAYQNNTFSFATRLGWLATEFYDYTLSIRLPMLNSILCQQLKHWHQSINK